MVRTTSAIAAAIGLITSGEAEAARYKVELAISGNQATRMESGNRQIASLLESGIVLLMAPGQSVEDRPVVVVTFLNSGGAAVDFGPANVRVCLGDTPCGPTLTYEQLVAYERKKAKQRAFAMAIAGAADSFSAGMSGQYSGSGTVYGGGQTYNYNYSGINEAQRQNALRQAQDRSTANQEEIVRDRDARISSLSGVLQTTTVDPRHQSGGLVMFDPPKRMKKREPVPIAFEINVANETHRIAGTLTKQ